MRVNAARAQSPVRRLLKLGRALTQDGLDAEAGEAIKALLVQRLVAERDLLRASGSLQPAVDGVLTVSVHTFGLDQGSTAATSAGNYTVAMASADLAALFERVGLQLSNGLHMAWWQTHAERDADEVKAELVVICRQAGVLERLGAAAQAEFDRRFRRHRTAIRALHEARKQHYDHLRLASAKPVAVEWQLPPSIAFRRSGKAPQYDRHLYVEADGTFRADLGPWEKAVVEQALADTRVVGWLRNVDRQPWSLEVDYVEAGEPRPMYPDLVFVRREGTGFIADVLEPHDPSRGDNVPKAIGLARFAEEHGAGYGCIGLVRKLRIATGVEEYRVLDCNNAETRRRTRQAGSPASLEQLFLDHGVRIGQ